MGDILNFTFSIIDRSLTLKKREEVLDKKYPNTLININNLATVLQNQRKYPEVEELYRQTLKTDLLNISASISAILQLSGTVIKYLNDVKDASEDR